MADINTDNILYISSTTVIFRSLCFLLRH